MDNFAGLVVYPFCTIFSFMQTYHNGHIDIPTDEDLQLVATGVTEILQGDWSILQVPLEIPDHIMLDVLHQRTIKQQVLRQVPHPQTYIITNYDSYTN